MAQTSASHSREPPTATVENGTLRGLHLPDFDEDLFLGVPFAQPPLGDLRFRHPIPYNSSWRDMRDASVRSASCTGYAGFAKGLTLGEDCLTVDIVRPAGVEAGDQLPVFVWIYGGGFTAGGSADPRYNTSYIVNSSVSIEKPIIAVSINYRLGGWGFLASKEVFAAGVANIGLFDQRLALKWINENIAAFGGDPYQVTICGESAGGFSVGYHLVGFDGDHAGLFRAAIMQSGTALGPAITSAEQLAESYQGIYDNVTKTVGCEKSTDTLACLRHVPYELLFQAFSLFVLTPVIDGTFISRLPSESFARGLVADVAILAGSNTDEGTATFFGPRGTLNNDSDVQSLLAKMGSGLDDKTVAALMKLYPDDPIQGCPFNTGSERFAQNGVQYKRGAAVVGDMVIHAGRRFTTSYYAALPCNKKKPVYSYRFDQSTWNGVLELIATDSPVFSTHYAEICFLFNLDPYSSRNNTNWIGPYSDYYALSRVLSQAWISFVHDLDPNHELGEDVPRWPKYSHGRQNFVFKVSQNHVEKDDWRLEQLDFLSTIWSHLRT